MTSYSLPQHKTTVFDNYGAWGGALWIRCQRLQFFADIGGGVFNASCFVEIDGQLVKVGLGVTSPLISCP